MRRCVLTFPALSGTGVQTVTGVSELAGRFRWGSGDLPVWMRLPSNTLTSGGAHKVVGTYGDSRGVDTGTLRSALSVSGLYLVLNFKAQDSGESLGEGSIATVISDSFGSGVLDRVAKITAFRSGEFDLTYTTNTRTGDTIMAIVLAEIDITFTNNSNGTYTTPSKPQGLLAASVPGLASSGGTSVATEWSERQLGLCHARRCLWGLLALRGKPGEQLEHAAHDRMERDVGRLNRCGWKSRDRLRMGRYVIHDCERPRLWRAAGLFGR